MITKLFNEVRLSCNAKESSVLIEHINMGKKSCNCIISKHVSHEDIYDTKPFMQQRAYPSRITNSVVRPHTETT